MQQRKSQHKVRRAPIRSFFRSPLVVLAVLGLLLAGYAALAPRASAGPNPHPREGITAARVQPPERYVSDPQIAAVYAEVAKIPEVVDGIYCYCRCSEHHGHESLLSCFESDRGAMCDTCLAEAHGAYLMGASLDEIRQAIDARMGSGG